MRTDAAPPAEGTMVYAEDHCAVRWPLVFQAVFWPILLAATIIVLIVTGDPDLSFLPLIPLAGTAFSSVVVSRRHQQASAGGADRYCSTREVGA